MTPQAANHDRARRFVQHVRTNVRKRDARDVARLIVRIAQNPNPRLRYRIGDDAELGYWLRALLPWKTYERILAKAVHID
jgi:hypothetical protein